MTLSLSDIEHLNLVKQGNPLVDSLYRMSTNEQKIILLASKLVNQMGERGIPFDERTEIVITGEQYMNEYDVSKQYAYYILCVAKNTIFKRTFTYLSEREDGTKKLMRSYWLHSTSVNQIEGVGDFDDFMDDVPFSKETAELLVKEGKSEITLMFSPAVIPHIYNIKSAYTLLDINEVGKLRSKYAIRLYKVLMKWRRANYQPIFTIEEVRALFGLRNDEYQVMSDFKKRVINVAVSQINKSTGFVGLKAVTKKGRSGKIVSFAFEYDSYDNKTINVTATAPAASKKTGELVIYQMTLPQIDTFAGKIRTAAENGESGFTGFGNWVGEGKSWVDFEVKVRQDLTNHIFAPYMDALRLLEFTPNKFNKTPPVGSTSENKAIPEANHEDSSKESVNNPFELSDAHYELYVKKGGKLSKDQILEAAMADNVSPVKIMIANGVNIKAA